MSGSDSFFSYVFSLIGFGFPSFSEGVLIGLLKFELE